MRTITQLLLTTAIITQFLLAFPDVTVAKDPSKPKSSSKERNSERPTSITVKKPGATTKSDSKTKSRPTIATLPKMKLKARGGKIYLILEKNVKKLEAYASNRLLGKLGSGKSFYINPYFEKAQGKDVTFGNGRLRSRRFTQKEYSALLPAVKRRESTAKNTGKSASSTLSIKEISQKNGNIVVVFDNTGPIDTKDYHKARVELSYGGNKHSWPLSQVAPPGAFKKDGQIVFKTNLQPDKHGPAKVCISGLTNSTPSSAMTVAMIIPKAAVAKPGQEQSVPMQSDNPPNPLTGPPSSSEQPLAAAPTTSANAPLSPTERLQLALGNDDPNKLTRAKGEALPVEPITTDTLGLTSGIDPDKIAKHLRELAIIEGITHPSGGGIPSGGSIPPSGSTPTSGQPTGSDDNDLAEWCANHNPPPPAPESPLWTGPDYSQDIIITEPGFISISGDLTVLNSSTQDAEAKIKISQDLPAGAVKLERIDVYTYSWGKAYGVENVFDGYHPPHNDETIDIHLQITPKTKELALEKARRRNPCGLYTDVFAIEFPAIVEVRYCYLLSENIDVDIENVFFPSYEWSATVNCEDFPCESHFAYVPVKVISHKN